MVTQTAVTYYRRNCHLPPSKLNYLHRALKMEVNMVFKVKVVPYAGKIFLRKSILISTLITIYMSFFTS